MGGRVWNLSYACQKSVMSPFVGQVRLQSRASSQGRAGLFEAVWGAGSTGWQEVLYFLFQFLLQNWNGLKVGQRNSCDTKFQINFSLEYYHSISSWVQILLWTLDVKGASKCGSRTYWSIFSFQNGAFPISTLSYEAFNSDRPALPNAKASFQKVLFLSRKFPGSSAFHVMLHEFYATPCCSALS